MLTIDELVAEVEMEWGPAGDVVDAAKHYRDELAALRERVAEAERLLAESRDVFGVIGAQYQRKVGPYATQCQNIGQRIAAFLRAHPSAGGGRDG